MINRELFFEECSNEGLTPDGKIIYNYRKVLTE